MVETRAPRYDQLLFKFLKNAAGSRDMNVDGSSTPVPFYYEVPAGRNAEVSRVNFTVVDGAMGYGEFGGLGAALTNGLKVEIHNSSGVTLFDFLDGFTVKVNEDFDGLAGIDTVIHPVAGDDSMPVRWTISRAIPRAHGLVLDAGQRIAITVQDDLSNLTKFRAMIQGRYW